MFSFQAPTEREQRQLHQPTSQPRAPHAHSLRRVWPVDNSRGVTGVRCYGARSLVQGVLRMRRLAFVLSVVIEIGRAHV